MKRNTRIKTAAIAVIVFAAVTGCSKKQDQPVQDAENSTQSTAPAVEQDKPQSAPVDVPKQEAASNVLPTPPEGGWPVESVRGLKLEVSKKSDIIEVFGEPIQANIGLRYNLPDGTLKYLFVIPPEESSTLRSVVIRDPDFKLSTGIGIGSSQEDLFKVYGEKPLKQSIKQKNRRIWGISYHEHSNIYFELWQDDGVDENYVGQIGIKPDSKRD